MLARRDTLSNNRREQILYRNSLVKGTLRMSLKSRIEAVLRFSPPLYRMGSRLYHRMNPEFKTLSPGAPGAIRKAFELTRLDPDARSFDGDYYEFGLFRGGTFLAAFQLLQEFGLKDTRLYGFDSFEGLPEAEGVDMTDTRFFEGQFACSREEVEQNLASEGMDLSRAVLVEGFYEDSLTDALHQAYPFRPASVLLLDCDYYRSTVVAMAWMERYIRPGTVLLFDDWFSYGDDTELGQQKAMSEWLADHPQYRVDHLLDFEAHGRGFVVRAA